MCPSPALRVRVGGRRITPPPGHACCLRRSHVRRSLCWFWGRDSRASAPADAIVQRSFRPVQAQVAPENRDSWSSSGETHSVKSMPAGVSGAKGVANGNRDVAWLARRLSGSPMCRGESQGRLCVCSVSKVLADWGGREAASLGSWAG